ncbi:MAG: AAA family ATPase [Bacillota bacterium]
MKGIKIAVSGKGGAGKTTLAAALIRAYAVSCRRVYAVDADPDASLAEAVGITGAAAKKIRPVIEMKEQINKVMGGEGEFFTLNPEVAEILDDFSYKFGNILFIRMGGLKKGGTSCYCRENVFLNAVMTALLLERDEVVIMDMPAGIEHLSRGTARGVDVLLIVTEPNSRSINTGLLVEGLAADIGVPRVAVVGNKVESGGDAALIEAAFPEKVIGMLPFDRAAYRGEADFGADFVNAVAKIKDELDKERVN